MADQFDLSGKVAIVTGGGKGIGKAIALALAGAGAKVVVASRTEAELEAVVAEIKGQGGEALAQAIDENRFEISRLAEMEDQAVIEAITALRGFGVWSAEIYLMFSLQRSDIFPAGDLAIRVALQKLKQIDSKLSEKQAREIVISWAPYRSAGSLFLWHYYRGAPT